MKQEIGPISVLRIYFCRQTLEEEPLSHYLARTAIQAGIEPAAIHSPRICRTGDTAKVSYDNHANQLNASSDFMELLGSSHLLAQFIKERAKHLKSTTLVMVDGSHISDLDLVKLEYLIEGLPHSIERIRSADGETEVTVEHVNADELEEEEEEEQEEEEREERRRINTAVTI